MFSFVDQQCLSAVIVKFFFIVILSFMCVLGYAQSIRFQSGLDTITPLFDTVRHKHFATYSGQDSTLQLKLAGFEKREKKFWRAGTEWFLAQAFPATFNRFITKDPYSYISFKNFIGHQRISAWDWDDNQFTTNQIDHPYHGQLYFNAFRSNGYNFYQSSLATLAGSYIWETAGETQHPSINDLVNTTY